MVLVLFFSGFGVFTALQKTTSFMNILECMLSHVHFTVRAFNNFFKFIYFLGGSSTTGSGFSSTTIGSTGSTDSFTILIFGLALGFDFGFALGLISSSLVYSFKSSSIIVSFTGSSLLIISII